MDIPILNQLEKIYPNQDTGAVAIRKLVKNQNLIEQGIKEIDDINDLDEIRDKIGVLTGLKTTVKTDLVSAVNENREQINDLNGKFTQPTITLYGGWVANDSVPFAVKVGTLLRVYARIKSGATASNTKIADIANISTQFPNQFFTIKDTLTGANLGQAYLTPNGDIYTLIELTANGDYLLNESFIVLG